MKKSEKITDRDVKKKILPVVEEEISVEKVKEITSEIVIDKDVETYEESIQIPIEKDQVEIEHFPIGKVIDDYPSVRKENGKTIIPVVKERLVVRKELFLEEEIHIQRTKSEHIQDIKETLRRDVVNIKKKQH